MKERFPTGKPMRKADAILIAALLIVSIIGAVFALYAGSYTNEANVRVTANGALYGVYPIGGTREIVVKGIYENRIVIERDGGKMQVRMADATCPGKDCVRHAPVNLSGQCIVCLPNRLLVEIVGGENDFDAFTY
ncbi:MAG: NusG domain II-containing protein [Clostridiales Family XIII bacterium]|jgi:hypothetical protein|nr:NusG domain II-containing protein [Clostridiales Family XIII bacterium]